jgi:reactive intermediate/imine deaminase
MVRFSAIVAATLAVAGCAHTAPPSPAAAPPAAAPAAAAPAAAPARAQPVTSAQAPKAIGPYSQAIDVPGGRFVFLAGQIPLDPATGEIVQGDVVAQTERVLQNLGAVLEAAGAGFGDVVKTTIFVTDLADFKAVNDTYAKYFTQAPPARATVQVKALPRGSKVEIEAVAVASGQAGPAARVIQSDKAPKAIGPYSQAIEAPAGRLVYLAGQLPLDPATGEMIQGDAAAQADRIMQNLRAVAQAAGGSLDNVVKTTIYVTDLADFKAINDAYGKFFTQAPPARATVQMAALPRGTKVEIEAVAAIAGAPAAGGGRTRAVQSDGAPKAIGPYSQAIEVAPGRMVYLAGQIPLDPATGELIQGDVVAQTERVMQNLKAVLEAAGTGFDRVVKTTIYLTDLADFKVVNEAYGKYFTQSLPARATVQVAALPRGAKVEIEVVAAP